MGQTFIVFSSHGYLTVDRTTGKVTNIDYNGDDVNFLNIDTMDVKEYREHYKRDDIPDNVDILDLGYTLRDGTYEEPAHDWRAEFRK